MELPFDRLAYISSFEEYSLRLILTPYTASKQSMISCGMYSVQTNRFNSLDLTSTLFAGAGQSKPEGAFLPLEVDANGTGVGGSVGLGGSVAVGACVACGAA